MCAARRHQLDRSERSIHVDAGETKGALAPQDDEEVFLRLGLILRCEGEARASKDEVTYYAMIPQVREGGLSTDLQF